jgi:hypothetical protein
MLLLLMRFSTSTKALLALISCQFPNGLVFGYKDVHGLLVSGLGALANSCIWSGKRRKLFFFTQYFPSAGVFTLLQDRWSPVDQPSAHLFLSTRVDQVKVSCLGFSLLF